MVETKQSLYIALAAAVLVGATETCPDGKIADRYGVCCTEADMDCLGLTVRARPGRLNALSVSHSESILRGAFIWARRALKRPFGRFPARAVSSGRTAWMFGPQQQSLRQPPRHAGRLLQVAHHRIGDGLLEYLQRPELREPHAAACSMRPAWLSGRR